MRSVLPNRLLHVETAFAMTMHKAQVSQFLLAAIAMRAASSEVLTRELVYTGMTRAKERITLLTPDSTALDDTVLKQTKRASGLSKRIRQHNATWAATCMR